MTLPLLLICSLTGTLCFMTILWAISLIQKKADIVDAGWAFSVGGLGAVAGLSGTGDPTTRLMITLMAGIWGLRLTLHLLFDRVLRPEEDGRYSELRASWGQSATGKFFLFFWVQGALAFILALPFFFLSWSNPSDPTLFNPNQGAASLGCSSCVLLMQMLAAALWIISIAGEALADLQLKRFRSAPENRGKTCRTGLWRYSRHPNYFFEWLHWLSYVTLGLGLYNLTPLWWTPVLPALLVLYLILYVTGIPPIEARSLKSRGEDFIKYQQETSAFFPWFPRKS